MSNIESIACFTKQCYYCSSKLAKSQDFDFSFKEHGFIIRGGKFLIEDIRFNPKCCTMQCNQHGTDVPPTQIYYWMDYELNYQKMISFHIDEFIIINSNLDKLESTLLVYDHHDDDARIFNFNKIIINNLSDINKLYNNINLFQ